MGKSFEANKRFIKPVHSKIERAGGMHRNTEGFSTRYKRMGSERWKWRSEYNTLFANEDINYDELWIWLESNRNIVFAQEPSNTPHRIYPASVTQMEYNAPYRSIVKAEGNLMKFTIEES